MQQNVGLAVLISSRFVDDFMDNQLILPFRYVIAPFKFLIPLNSQQVPIAPEFKKSTKGLLVTLNLQSCSHDRHKKLLHKDKYEDCFVKTYTKDSHAASHIHAWLYLIFISLLKFYLVLFTQKLIFFRLLTVLFSWYQCKALVVVY